MSTEIQLTVEKFHEGEESKFLIKSPKEIQLTLKAIAQKKSTVVLYFDNGNRFLKTILLGANEQGIWLDVGPDENDNTALLNSEIITFVTLHRGAKVQFICHQSVVAIYASHPAFYFPLPEKIYRVQRRDYFRLATTADMPLNCLIADEKIESARTVKIPIMDISLGGIALICKESGISVEVGEVYSDCRIELPDVGTLNVTLQVKNLFYINTPSGATIKHAGCEFAQMDGQMSMLLQRYIAMMQSRQSGHF